MPEPPERVVTDGHSSYPGAISEVLGKAAQHEVSQSVHNPVEQSHRKLKQRYYPTMGFSNVETAGYFCEAVEELNLFGFIPRPLGRNNSRGLPHGFIPLIQFWRVRRHMTEFVSLPEHRLLIQARMVELRDRIKAA